MFGDICIKIQISKAHDVPQIPFNFSTYTVLRNNFFGVDRGIIQNSENTCLLTKYFF